MRFMDYRCIRCRRVWLGDQVSPGPSCPRCGGSLEIPTTDNGKTPRQESDDSITMLGTRFIYTAMVLMIALAVSLYTC